MFFQNRSQGPFMSVPVPIFIENLILVSFPIFEIFKKAPFGRPFPLKSRLSVTRRVRESRPCRDPTFHHAIVITMPLGPTGFLKLVY